MYFQDLSDEQLFRVVDMLKQDPRIVASDLPAKWRDEVIDDWMNRNNTSETVMMHLERAYSGSTNLESR